MATNVDIIIISKDSFPFAFLERALIPAVKEPVLFIIPIKPPITNTKAMISMESYKPCTGAFKKVDMAPNSDVDGQGSCSYVPGIPTGLLIEPSLNLV